MLEAQGLQHTVFLGLFFPISFALQIICLEQVVRATDSLCGCQASELVADKGTVFSRDSSQLFLKAFHASLELVPDARLVPNQDEEVSSWKNK